MNKMSSAMMVAEHLINNDMNMEELKSLAEMMMQYIPDGMLMKEVKERGYTCRVEFVKA